MRAGVKKGGRQGGNLRVSKPFVAGKELIERGASRWGRKARLWAKSGEREGAHLPRAEGERGPFPYRKRGAKGKGGGEGTKGA